MESEDKTLLNAIEKKMLILLSQGYTEKETAVKINKGVFTVDKYLRDVFSKLNVHSTTAAVAEAMRRKEIK